MAYSNFKKMDNIKLSYWEVTTVLFI